jgi:hypothetical protein
LAVTFLSQLGGGLSITIFKMSKRTKATSVALFAGASALAVFVPQACGGFTSDALINKLEQKGILTADEAKELRAESEASDTNLISQIPASKWQLSSAIKTIQLFGDVRLRYEYRGADNPFIKPGVGSIIGTGNSGETGKTYDKERFRYAVRLGLRGDLSDDWNYGLRIETSSNPRSQFVTFGGNTGQALPSSAGTPTTGGTPSDKSGASLYIGQAYIGWTPFSWLQMTVGKMPQPLYTTPMVWSSSLSPEGAFEKVQASIGPVDVFADAGQFDYQDPTASQAVVTSDTFVLAEQVGMDAHLGKSMFAKVAPVVYVYAGHGNPPAPRTTLAGSPGIVQSLYYPFIGQGDPSGPDQGFNDLYNQIGINDLLIVEVPLEFDFKIYHTPLGTLQARLFGDVAYNYEGDDRARAAFAAEPAAFPGFKKAPTGENAAYQIGIGIGSDGPVYGPMQGLVYGTTAKKHAWEARFYWQHIDQYALDVNLLDADFFEGRGNLQGFYTAFSYSITDAIIGTLRYGTADRIDSKLGTGGSNPDLPLLNPIRDYQLVQADLTWRF